MIGHTLLQPESDTTACTCHRRFTKRDTLINEGSKQKQSQIHKKRLKQWILGGQLTITVV